MIEPIELAGKHCTIVVGADLRLSLQWGRQVLLRSSGLHVPAMTVMTGQGGPQTIPLAAAGEALCSDFAQGNHAGRVVRLSRYPGTDAALELVFALDVESDELLIQVAQCGGDDHVVSIGHLYRFEKPVTDGGYMVLPRGSGYIIPADCSDELPGEGSTYGLIGAHWSLPMFGMVGDGFSMCATVETWWDCEVGAEHAPGDRSSLDFNWVESLGKLAYPRRMLIRFDPGMDYVAMAKLYRKYAGRQGLLHTLEQKAAENPTVSRYVGNILFRWPAWNEFDGSAVLEDIRKLHGMGFGVNFFFPKWPSTGYSLGRSAPQTTDGGWQAYLRPDPVPGGWKTLRALADDARELGCTIQAFIAPLQQVRGAPAYDESRWPRDAAGEPSVPESGLMSMNGAPERLRSALDSAERNGLRLDALYFDGYSAFDPLSQDLSSLAPVTRKRGFELQNACFAEARRRGIIPGGELGRFWCMADCAFFFFTDWARDRLTNVPSQGAEQPVGEPIPLFQLVFHDCYAAGFSGGGYGLMLPGYDWWRQRTPRLYELLFASAPAHNWLPNGAVPVPDWGADRTRRRWEWLKTWSAYYRTIAMSEMVSHQFLSADLKRQRIEFANGVAAEFDLAANRFRVLGLPGFSGDWTTPQEL